MKKKSIIAVLISCSLAIAACGKKGELEPPDKNDEQASVTTAKG